MNRGLKFKRLRQLLEKCSESVMYYDEINFVVKKIQQIESLLTAFQFHPIQVFNKRKHVVDLIAKSYLDKAADDVHHLLPVDVPGDGNCLYYSILVLMNNSSITTDELRVRTIIELTVNENYYQTMYAQHVGPIDIAIQSICKDHTFSELYEIAALCNVLQCNIRSVYPKIDFQHFMASWDSIFTPLPSVIANYSIAVLWSHGLNENDVRAMSNGTWSPNHFVPLLSPNNQNESDDYNNSTSFNITPQKNTFKNSTAVQIRIPEFQSSPNRRLRTDDTIKNCPAELIVSGSIQNGKNDKEKQRQIQLEKKRQDSRSRRMNETEQQTQDRLEKARERSRSRRKKETKQQTQDRLEKAKERSRSIRANQTEEEHQNRLQKKTEQARSTRMNEPEEQHQTRLEKQRKLSKTSRLKKKIEKQLNENINIDRNNIGTQFSTSQSWPQPIARELKEACLQQFLEQMSMSVLAEVTCAVCNIRTPKKDSKTIPVRQIPNIHLLKVSDQLKDFIKHLNKDTQISVDNSTETTERTENPLTFDSSSFYCENDVILYKSGLFQQNKVDMCRLCQKCHSALLKKSIPKFSTDNNMWLGDIPIELQGLTIPEQKLISLYRHNSCIIKLHSPFHSATTAQPALKGNCITFLQNVPNIVDSLPLALDDLCDTLKVIFIGARPPDRIQLRKVLTVRKKKIIEALRWLKKHNILYQKVNINLQNINQLPEDDVPECIMSTLEQKIGDKEIPSERAGYVPDPLSNPLESTATDSIPISNSGVLDINGTSVSSEEIPTCVLNRIKNNGRDDEINTENVYLIPHSSRPVNEYFNPKLLAGLYPTLFCYGLGAPEDQSRPVTVNLREHIRYLLSYNDRRFETNHSFIFVVFNLLQRRDACFHAQLIATKPYFRTSADEIQSLSSKDIEIALENSLKWIYSTGSYKTLNKLLQHIKTIGGRIMGSAYSRMALRTQIHALIYNQGLPSIFLTINPADIHSPIALYFAGVKIDLDNIQKEQLMDAYKRAETIASHPVGTAKFFHVLITNILDTMIMRGVLGPVKAYFGTVESQG
ncbi:unnamed protein product [Adineta steineri]|uniref:OTU domain-containing protein n=1 Tax=Adineta steineri TaxID=433720 RepID=A0A819F0E9_9BILA|nr:unnamed protein product [Adineta steineri]